MKRLVLRQYLVTQTILVVRKKRIKQNQIKKLLEEATTKRNNAVQKRKMKKDNPMT